MKLGLGSPWTRAPFARLDPDTGAIDWSLRDEVDALIPDGYRIVVTATDARHGRYTLTVWQDGRADWVERRTGLRDAVHEARTMALGLQRLAA